MHLVSLWIPIKAVPVNYMYVHELLTGRHPCLWCEIRADEMSTPASMREPSKPRSLQSLEADYSAFVAAGGDIRRAKNYNNVIAPYFFKITLDQVYTCIHTCTHAITTTNSSTCPYTCTYMTLYTVHCTFLTITTGNSSRTSHQSWNLLSFVQAVGVRVPQAGLEACPHLWSLKSSSRSHI